MTRLGPWHKTLAPVEYAGETWTHVGVDDANGQLVLARLSESGLPTKICRLAYTTDDWLAADAA